LPFVGELDELGVTARRLRVGIALIGAVGLHLPCVAIRRQLRIEHRAQITAQSRILYRHHHLDPALEVSGHAVGRSDQVFLLAAVAEVVDAAVLEEAADDADHAHVLGQPGNARPQAAGVAHQQLDFHAGL
jgi:hypothetical protein